MNDAHRHPFRILTVCWGNICRSPMAEFALREAFEEAGLGDAVHVSSAGTSAEELGNAMDRRAIAALTRNGVQDTGFRAHRARRFTADWFARFDLILAADYVHERILRELAPTAADQARVRLLRSFDPEAVAAGDLGMADPWYGGEADFDLTFAQVAAAISGVVDYVRAQLAS